MSGTGLGGGDRAVRSPHALQEKVDDERIKYMTCEVVINAMRAWHQAQGQTPEG